MTTYSEGGFLGNLRAERDKPRPAREPRPSLAAVLGVALGVVLRVLLRVRTEMLTIGGLGFMATGAWLFSPITGCIAVGLALWALEWLLRQ